MAGTTHSHAALMDTTYRYQRRIYDATRRYYLLGRDHLIGELAPPQGGHVLEVACGTGRNLDQIAARYPDCVLYGLDISEEMLRSARAKLGRRATLVQADACDFDADGLFGRDLFDRIIFSFSLSMIPDWETALNHAHRLLAPGGQLHIVDFGSQKGLPAWFRTALHAWLGRFHVTPRETLEATACRMASDHGGRTVSRGLYRDYSSYVILSRAHTVT